MTDFAKAKFNMIEQQIRPWEVLDPKVLEVFSQLDRDQFVPEQYKGLAYADCQLPVADGGSMLPPTVEGRMLQALNLQSSDNVLEIGSGYGYITACLAHLAQQVDSADFSAEASARAQANLEQLGLKNINLRVIASLDEINLVERYDAILIAAGSLPEVPQNLKTALAIGGRLFAVTGHSPAKQAQLITRVGPQQWNQVNLFETDIADIKVSN